MPSKYATTSNVRYNEKMCYDVSNDRGSRLLLPRYMLFMSVSVTITKVVLNFSYHCYAFRCHRPAVR